MRIAILSPHNEKVGYMDNLPPKALHYYDDTLHRYLTGTVDTFEFKAPADHEDSILLDMGNKLTFIYEGREYYLNIVKAIQTENEISVTAWGGTLEFTHETAIACSGTSLSFEAWVKKNGIDFSGVKIGINEVSGQARSNEWTGTTDTVLTRLYSIATLFDAEIEFLPVLDDFGALDYIQLNIYKEHDDTHQGIGLKRSDRKLRYGIDVSGVTRTVDITGLFTAIRPTGKDGLTLTNYTKTIYDDYGDVLYTTAYGYDFISAPQARDRYPSNIVAASERHICYNWTTDYETQAELWSNSVAKLKTGSTPAVSYVVSGVTDIGIGDTVTVIDEKFTPKLELSVRVSEQVISFSDSSKNSTTFSNVVEA